LTIVESSRVPHAPNIITINVTLASKEQDADGFDLWVDKPPTVGTEIFVTGISGSLTPTSTLEVSYFQTLLFPDSLFPKSLNPEP